MSAKQKPILDRKRINIDLECVFPEMELEFLMPYVKHLLQRCEDPKFVYPLFIADIMPTECQPDD